MWQLTRFVKIKELFKLKKEEKLTSETLQLAEWTNRSYDIFNSIIIDSAEDADHVYMYIWIYFI